METNLQVLHQQYTAATAAFRAEAFRQGYRRTDIGDERYFWLKGRRRDVVLQMLKANDDPIEYCFALVETNEAFFEYLPPDRSHD